MNIKNQSDCLGVSSCIDLYVCDLVLMQDDTVIKQFVRELYDLIKMRRFGETQVVRFGDGPRVTGFSMTQLIETPLTSAHFCRQLLRHLSGYLQLYPIRPERGCNLCRSLF